MPFDERTWIQVDAVMDDQTLAATFVPKGQSLTNWTEKIEAKMLPDRQRIVPREYLQTLLEGLDKISGGEADVALISEGSYGLLYSWKLRKPKGQTDLDQITTILPGKRALHLISYTRKGTDWPLSNRNAWIKRWKQITLRYPPKRK